MQVGWPKLLSLGPITTISDTRKIVPETVVGAFPSGDGLNFRSAQASVPYVEIL
jgi:hypothetical protein